MSIAVTCACTMEYRLPDRYAGKRCRCRECGGRIRVPQTDRSSGDVRRGTKAKKRSKHEGADGKRRKKRARNKRPSSRDTTRRMDAQDRDILRERRVLRASERRPVSESIHQIAPLRSGERLQRHVGLTPSRNRKARKRARGRERDLDAHELRRAPKRTARRSKPGKRTREASAARAAAAKSAAPVKGRAARGAKRRTRSLDRKRPARKVRSFGHRSGEEDGADSKRSPTTPALWAVIAIAGVLCLGIGLVVGGGLLIGQVAQSEASSRVDKKLSQIQELKESRKWESAKTAADALEIELKKLDDRQGLSKLYASVAGIDKMIQILAVEDDEARLGSLLQYSGDKDAAVRMGIAWELRPFAEELDEAQSSLAVLARDADVKVAKVAQQALVQAGGPYAIPYLTAALERSPSTGDEQDDIALARTLEIDDPAVLPALLKILELRPEASPSVLRQVLGRIGEYGNAQSIPAVEPFTKHSDGEVAELAKDVIRELKA